MKMSLEQFAAQNPLPAPIQPARQDPAPLDAITARLEAERLHLLLVDVQAALDAQTAPAKTLQAITGAIYGPDSQQAADVAQAVKDHREPLAAVLQLRNRRRYLQGRLTQLQNEMERTAADLETTEDAEQEAGANNATDLAIIEVLEVLRQNRDHPRPQCLAELTRLYKLNKPRRTVAGLLAGVLAEITTGPGAAELTLTDLEQAAELRRQLEQAIWQ